MTTVDGKPMPHVRAAATRAERQRGQVLTMLRRHGPMTVPELASRLVWPLDSTEAWVVDCALSGDVATVDGVVGLVLDGSGETA